MKYFYFLAFFLCFFTMQAQEEILDYCMIFEFDLESSDIKEAAFQLPFMAGRSDTKASEVKHYGFKMNQPESKPTDSNARILTIKGVRNYQMESEISSKELAFFVCAFDPVENKFAQFEFPLDAKIVFASFPTPNEESIKETFLYLPEKLILPGAFNTLTKGNLPEMQKGYYKLEGRMVKN